MNESTAAIDPLHMRKTTDFVTSGIPNLKQLQGTEKKSGAKYLDQLATLLQKGKFVHSAHEGTYTQIYNPQNNQNVAVKIFDTIATYDRSFPKLRRYTIYDRINDIGFDKMGITEEDIKERRINTEEARKIGQKELENILKNKSYIKFADRKVTPRFEDLNETEKTFLYIAWEHVLYQKLYSPYVLPSVFVAYQAPEDILGSEQYDPGDDFHRTIIERARNRGDEFNQNYFRIIAKKGETAYAMVQDFQDLGPAVFDIKPANLTKKQRLQLLDFANKLELVCKQTGYYPDASMMESNNLVFDKEERLILIDSNHITNRRYATGAQSFVLNCNIKRLKEISS